MIASFAIVAGATIVAFVFSRWLLASVFRREKLAGRVAFAVAALVLAIRAAHSDLGTTAEPSIPTTPPDVEARNAPPPNVQRGPTKCARTASAHDANGALDIVRTKQEPMAAGEIVGRSSTLYFLGWAISADRRSLAQSLCLIVDGKPMLASIDYGSQRPDVAAVFRDDALLRSGYLIELPGSILHAGNHRFEVVVESADGSRALIAKELRLELR